MPADDLLDIASGRIARILAELADNLARELLLAIGRLNTQGGNIKRDRDNAASVVEIRRQIAAIAARDGVPTVLRAMSEDLPEVVQEALRDHPGLGIYAPEIVGDLERFFAAHAEDVAAYLTEDAPLELARVIRRGVTSGLDLSDLQAELAQRLDTTMGRAAVLADRGMRDFHEAAVKETGRKAAEALGETLVYVYVGPEDGVTRDYCEARVDKYLTQEQADALDPTERYNCRHSLAATTLAEAREEGVQPFTART